MNKKSTYQELENQITELKKSHKESTLEENGKRALELNIANKELIIAKENQYKMLFDSMTEMVQIIELIYDDQGKPIDCYIR